MGLSHLIGIRLFISFVGLLGNIFLIVRIIQTMTSRVKSYELFLLGLAAANLEEIIIVNIYDIIILRTSTMTTSTWTCRSLKFLTILGENTSILFTVLISIYRYQKLRDAAKRVNLPIYLDSIRSAWTVSGLGVMLSVLLSAPVYAINPHDSAKNETRNSTGCPPNIFQCVESDCPVVNAIYKYLFLLLCNLLPLIIVTVSSCLIFTVLLSQRRTVTPALSMSGPRQMSRRSKGPRLQRSTIAILAAMGLFQVDWTLYMIFQLTVNPDEVLLWEEIEFFISTSYTSLSPYVYGIGNNLFSLKNLINK